MRIPEQGSGTVPFKLDRASIAAIWCFLHSQNFYLRKSRQTFMEGVIISIIVWSRVSLFDRYGIDFIVKNKTDGKFLENKLNTFEKSIPDYICKANDVFTTIVLLYKDDTQEVTLQELETPSIQYFPDIEFNPYGIEFNEKSIDQFLQNKSTSGNTGCRIYSSIPNTEIDSHIVDKDCVKWDDSFLDKSYEDLKATIIKDKTTVLIEYDWKQLGLDRSYFIDACISLGVDRRTADIICRELLLM